MKNSSYLDRLRATEHQMNQDHVQYIEQHRLLGEQDGRRNLPAVTDETIPPHEWQVLAHYQSKIDEVEGLVRQMLHDIRDSQWQPAVTAQRNWSQTQVEKQIQVAAHVRDRHLEQAAENHFDSLKVLENAPSYIQAKRDIEATENRLSAVAIRLGRYELNHKISPFWAISIAIAIGILEIPLNNQVFLMFRESNTTMTLLLSLSLVVVMPILAHISGRLFRQGNERPSNYFIASVLTIGVVVLSYFAAQLRTEAISDAPAASAPFFFVLNILFFSAAAIASFQAHDPSISLSDAHNGVLRERRRHAPTMSSFEKQISAEVKSYHQKKEGIQNAFSQAEEEAQTSFSTIQEKVHEATALYNQVLCMGIGFERTIQTYSHTVILFRRDQNLKFRTNHAQPKSWKSPLPLLTLSLQAIPEIIWPNE